MLNLCSLAQKYEDYAAMQRMVSEAVARGRAAASDYIFSGALTAIGESLGANNQPAARRPLLREALDLARPLNSPRTS